MIRYASTDPGKVDFLKTNQTRLNETVMGKQSQLEGR